MSLRVVLYAEGALESGSPPGFGEILGDDEMGPAQVLVRRVLVDVGRAPEPAIRFVRPRRLRTGKIARGSDLLSVKSLRQLLAWLPAAAATVRKTVGATCDLAVVASRCRSFARFSEDLRSLA